MKFKGKKSEGGGGGKLLEEGDYIFKVLIAKKDKTNNGDLKANVEFVSACKEAGKKHLWKDFIFEHSNEKVVEIATEQFENLVARTLGEVDFNFPKDLKKLHGETVGVHVVQTLQDKKGKKKGWKDKNEISYFFDADDGKKKKSKKKPF